MKVSPWVWVALIVACFAAQGAFAYLHVDGGGFVAAVFGAAMTALFGSQHATTERELTTLRRSMRPLREPSYPDLPTIPPQE